MKHKILIYLCMCILLAGFVASIDWASDYEPYLIHQLSCNISGNKGRDLADTGDFTDNGNMQLHEDKNGVADFACNFTGDSSLCGNNNTGVNTKRSYSFWIKKAGGSAQEVFMGYKTAGMMDVIGANNDGNPSNAYTYIGMKALDSGWQNNHIQANVTYNDNAWHHIAIAVDGADARIYVDGKNYENETSYYTGNHPNSMPLILGGYKANGCPDSTWFTGIIDEFLLINKTLSHDEVIELYTHYDNYSLISTGASTENFTLNTTIQYTSRLQETDYKNHTLLVMYNTTYINSSTTAIIYYNNTEYALTSSSSEVIGNLGIDKYYFNLSDEIVYNNNTAHSFYFNYTWRWQENSTTYTNQTASNTQNIDWNLDIYPRVNISAINLLGGATINSFSCNDSSKNISTTSGYLFIYQTATGDYNVTIDAPGYAYNTSIVNFTAGELGQYQYKLYSENSFGFSFYDEISNLLLNNINISVELISDDYANNYTTANGTLYIDLLTPSLYAVRYSAPGYYERFFYYNLTNRSHTNMSLYLLDTSNGTEVTAIVYDDGNRLVEDVYIKALKYDLATNSYILKEIGRTNWEGETILNLELNDEFYQFILEYPFGQVRKITSPTYITDTEIQFQILLGVDIAEFFYESNGVAYSLTFNNITNHFRYTYSNNENVRQGCLKVYKYDLYGQSLINSSCVESSSGTILIAVDNITGSYYYARAYVWFDDVEYFLTELEKDFQEENIAGKLGLFIILVITILFVFISKWSKAVALIVTPIPLMIGAIINLVDISVSILISIWVLCIIIAIWISRRDF